MISASELPAMWRKSSHSTNGGNCIEIGEPLDGLISTLWVKSSYSNGDGGGCVEWAPTHIPTGRIPVRDSKTPHGPALLFPTGSWQAFVTAVNEGWIQPCRSSRRS